MPAKPQTRAVELFPQHRVFRRGGTGEPINAPWLSTAPEVVDWGRAGEPNIMVTLNALRVLTAAGRVSVSR